MNNSFFSERLAKRLLILLFFMPLIVTLLTFLPRATDETKAFSGFGFALIAVYSIPGLVMASLSLASAIFLKAKGKFKAQRIALIVSCVVSSLSIIMISGVAGLLG